MSDINLTVIAPSQLNATGDPGPYDLSRFERKYLAQGDSWFSMGHIPPWSTTNLLDQMTLTRAAVAVNCARPGVELAHMTDTVSAGDFLRMLAGNLAWKWDALLVSGGGNDLIDAVQSAPSASADLRLLRTAAEWGAQQDASRYVSDAGWSTFAAHMEVVLVNLLDRRDGGINQDTPVFLHTYDYPTPRNAPAGPGFGPWLYPALLAFGVPSQDWTALAKVLIDSLAQMWQGLAGKYAARKVTVIDSRGSIQPASPDATGVSGDWENEIHPTPHGYTLLANCWRTALDAQP